jgi:glycolate oxidase iron-sulfur subunit
MILTPDQLLAEADRCVKCGLCLPLCPTYRVHRDESESPRGRIALIQGLHGGLLQYSDAGVRESLDHCLMCRQCEGGCPSGVRYAEIMDASRVLYGSPVPRDLADRVAKPSKALLGVGRLLQRAGADKLLQDGINKRLLSLAGYSSSAERFAPLYPAKCEPVGSVALFTGCQGPTTEPRVLKAAIECLTQYGYAVHVPEKQGCCGAVYQHAGFDEAANACRDLNQTVFENKRYSSVVTVSSGCSLQLHEYGGLNAPVREVIDVVASHLTREHFNRQQDGVGEGVKRRLGVMIPCSQKKLGGEMAVYQLLEQLTDCNIISLNGLGCCGAGGLNMVLFPHEAEKIAEPLLEEIRAARPDVIVTSNVGCAMQLRDQMHEQGLSIPVKHPLELIAEAFR